MTNKIPQEIEEKITIIVSPQANMSKREIEDTILYNKGFQKGFKAGQLQKQDECLRLLGFSNKEAGSKDGNLKLRLWN